VQDTLSTNKISDLQGYRKSSSFMMAILFTILCGTAIIILGYFINYFAKGHVIQTTASILELEIKLIEQSGRLPDALIDGKRFFVELADYPYIKGDFRSEISTLSEGIIVLDQKGTQRKFATKIHNFPGNKQAMIGYDITEISNDFEKMQHLGAASIVLIMLVVLVSYIISIFVVSGTNNIARTAREIIKTGDLSRRLDVSSKWDDLSNMAAVLNTLLDRIEKSIEDVRMVSNNIAHDLRTPLTRIRTRIEDLQTEKPDCPMIAEIIQDTDHLLSTFNALLRISRIEAEKQRSHFIDLDLSEILYDVAEFYSPLAEDKNIVIKLELNPVFLRGDRDLLFQAYGNILDNAIKFTPENGEITLSLATKGKHKIVTIRDNGPGIDEGQGDAIFRRFYREEKSRNTAGSGLGLSLVKAVIELHDGHITAQNSAPGLSVVTIF
jgi:signal transduction histidine kinase